MHVSVYMYTYIYIYTRIHIQRYKCVRMCIYIYNCIYVTMYKQINTLTRTETRLKRHLALRRRGFVAHPENFLLVLIRDVYGVLQGFV